MALAARAGRCVGAATSAPALAATPRCASVARPAASFASTSASASSQQHARPSVCVRAAAMDLTELGEDIDVNVAGAIAPLASEVGCVAGLLWRGGVGWVVVVEWRERREVGPRALAARAHACTRARLHIVACTPRC